MVEFVCPDNQGRYILYCFRKSTEGTQSVATLFESGQDLR